MSNPKPTLEERAAEMFDSLDKMAEAARTDADFKVQATAAILAFAQSVAAEAEERGKVEGLERAESIAHAHAADGDDDQYTAGWIASAKIIRKEIRAILAKLAAPEGKS